MAQWNIPRDMEDVPRCTAFDEATGIAVVGMHSGRLLVADAGSWVPPPPAPDDDSDSSAEGSDVSLLEWCGLGIHPFPKLWPRISSNPVFFYPKPLSRSEYPAQLPKGWFTDIEAFYPFANHPDYYGSIPWMVREVAGIPSGSRCIMFRSSDIDNPHGSNIALIELDAEVGNGGNLLLLGWSSEDPFVFSLYQLRPGVTKEMVIGRIQRGESVGLLFDDSSWSKNALCIGQLAAWLFPPNYLELEYGLIDYGLVSNPPV
ncbi:hypothetical protein FRC01_007242 [Tulasnella sp. 417]|nr:hypothetical protein FRC01_007242 [Tulasnella sp. 417]